MINASPINISAAQAILETKRSLSQKTITGIFQRTRIVGDITESSVKMLYIPYYIAVTHNIIGSKEFQIIVAAEGITGEAGVSLGRVQFEAAEVDDYRICAARLSEEDAREKIIYSAAQNSMRYKRRLPKTSIVSMVLLYKPTYVMPVEYTDGKIKKALWRFVDAESGYVIYRYDVIWRTFPQLMER